MEHIEVVPGGAQLLPAPVDLSAAPGILKADITGVLTSSWTVYLTVSATGARAGTASVLIMYSVPALATPA